MSRLPVLLLVLGLLAASGCAHLYRVPLPPAAQAHRAPTDDGWEIELVRYRPQGAPRGPPVVLCHGISANGRNMDLDEGHSMARYVASRGREAWTMSLRGAGTSRPVDPAKTNPAAFTFDAYWQHDLPAVVAYVRKVSGAPEVDYAGHSMGGMVLYAYLSQGGQGIRRAATLGTPTRLDLGTGVERLLKALSPSLLDGDFMLPSGDGAGVSAPFQTWFDDGPFQQFFYNPESTDPRTWQRLVAYGTANVSTGVARQLARLVRTGAFTSADGRLDFKAGMQAIRTPVLVIAARLDRIALSPAVRDGYLALGGEKQWRVITRANGSRGEYGHMDLVIAERAADEVWTHVIDFFEAQ